MRRHRWTRLRGLLGWGTSSSNRAVVEPWRVHLSTCSGAAGTIHEQEARVGILCYANSAPGFRGILKQRYSDFIVNEVDCQGNGVHLTSIDSPEEISNIQKLELQEFKNSDIERHIEAFRAIAGEHDAELLRKLLIKIIADLEDKNTPIVLAPDANKLHRMEVHNFFKSRYTFLVTDTIDADDSISKHVRVRFYDKRKKGNKRSSQHEAEILQCQHHRGRAYDSRGAESWPCHMGKYLQFHLYKENIETLEALTILSKKLGVLLSHFAIAGTKDKRGVTTQRVTVFKQRASKLASLNKQLQGMKLGNFCYVDKRVVLGQLSGNRFLLTLRGVAEENDEIIKEAADSFRGSGFINYFGLQRFGTCGVPTFTVGAALLRGEWETAVNLILQPQDGNKLPDGREACEYFQKTRDANGALLRMPQGYTVQRAVLTILKKYPGNFLQAINSIPKSMKRLYLHSYQSYLWNHAASRRAKLYGLDKVVEGDLVVCKDAEDKVPEISSEASIENFYNSDELFEEDTISNGADSFDVLQNVKHVTSEEATCGKYKIDDVVLPLPGPRTMLPANDVSYVYEELASKDLIKLGRVSHQVKEFSYPFMHGGYRRLIQRAADFDWKILKYHNQADPLAETDWDRLNKTAQEENQTKQDSRSDRTNISEKNENISNALGNQQTAVQLRFTLPPACYATMAVRELLKISSSVAFHKGLSEEAR